MTGFDVSHRPRYPIVGRNGVDLREEWKDDPESYISVAVPHMPNYFMMMVGKELFQVDAR